MPNEQIAIIGMGNRFPQAANPDAFWELLISKNEAIREVPNDRWVIDRHYNKDPHSPGKTYSKVGGFLNDVFDFDPFFFKISRSEAKYIDPQQRLMLEVCWQAFENAGIVPSSLANSATGVFVAASTFDYAGLSTLRLSDLSFYSGTGTNLSVIANRLSYIFNLKGPSFVVDTACSSSLVATHLACQSINSGESELAIVGGVNVMLSPAPFIGFCKGNVLSKDGHCRPFDKKANGFVRGEGCGVILLKKLSHAERDNNQILGVIDGSAINQDGLSNGIAAPNVGAQEKVIKQAWVNAALKSENINYIEAHGTATPIGDPIEMTALKRSFSQNENSCYVSSCKANIGHLESAAGIAALIKVLLCIKNGTIPGQLHFDSLNPNINLEGSCLKVPVDNTEWASERRIAGINSFGFGGTNAHVIVSEYVKQKKKSNLDQNAGPNVIVLSSKRGQSLKKVVEDLYTYVVSKKETIDLGALSYTLQCGREKFSNRLAVITSSVEDLIQSLRRFLDEKPDDSIFYGKAKRNNGEDVLSFGSDVTCETLIQTTKAWISGVRVDWKTLHKPDVTFINDLPSYPFEKSRIGFTSEELYSHYNSTKELHPLVHENCSSLNGIRFSTKLSGRESFLEDHIVLNKAILPGAAFVEIGLAVASLATKEDIFSLKNLAFLQPFVFSQKNSCFHVEIASQGEEDDLASFKVRGDESGELHCRGKFFKTAREKNIPQSVEIGEFKSKAEKEIGGIEFYNTYLGSSFHFGPSHRTIEHAWVSENSAIAFLRQKKKTGNCHINIGLLDGVFQASALMVKDRSNLLLPFSIRAIHFFEKLPEEIYAILKVEEHSPDKIMINTKLTDKEGKVLAVIERLTFLSITPTNLKL